MTKILRRTVLNFLPRKRARKTLSQNQHHTNRSPLLLPPQLKHLCKVPPQHRRLARTSCNNASRRLSTFLDLSILHQHTFHPLHKFNNLITVSLPRGASSLLSRNTVLSVSRLLPLHKTWEGRLKYPSRSTHSVNISNLSKLTSLSKWQRHHFKRNSPARVSAGILHSLNNMVSTTSKTRTCMEC